MYIKDNNIIFYTIIMILFLLIPTISATPIPEMYTGQIHESPIDDNEVEFQNIVCDSDYEYGRETGKRLSQTFNALNDITAECSSQEEQEIQDELNSLDTASLDELEGFADYLGITTIRAYYLIGIFLNNIPDMNCTTSVSTKEATINLLEEKDTYLTQNFDCKYTNGRLFWRICAKLPFITFFRYHDSYKYAFFGIPIFLEIPFINEKNLGFGGNALTLREDYTDHYDGTITCRRLYRETMKNCSTINEAEYLWYKSDRSGGRFSPLQWAHGFDNVNVAYVDANGGILMIEQMGNNTYFKAVKKNQVNLLKPDIIWHTNHHLWNGTIRTGSIVPDSDNSTFLREQEAKNLLTALYYFISLDALKSFFVRYHGGNGPDYGDICSHHDANHPVETIFSWIIEPKNSHVYWTLGRTTPCKSVFIPQNMKNRFERVDLDISGKKILLSPTYYHFEIGAIPYILQQSSQNNYFKDTLQNENDNASLIISAFLADMTATSNNIQRNHDYSITLSNTDYDSESFCSNISFTADGIANASVSTDDPVNHTWRSIQKAVDNLSTLDVLVIEKGVYTENLMVNKSLIILGVDTDNVIVNGSVTLVNPHDYILLNVTDPIMNMNMTGIQCLLHFDNTSDIGEESLGFPSIIHDYSPLENDGTNHNASVITSTIKGNSAFHFNGINSSVSLTSIPALVEKNITISAWIYWNDSNHSLNPILSQSNPTKGYCLSINGTTNTPLFQLGNHTIHSNTTIDNGWHHIVGTHNTTDLKLYMDGILLNSTTTSDSGINTTTYIGYDNSTHYFTGVIDEIAVWNRTLNASEIAHLYSLNYGVILDGITIQNSDIGITPVNHSDITNCHLKNLNTGISIDNLCDLKIQCNFTDCDTALNLTNSNPDNDNRIRLMDSTITQSTNGFHINSSSNLDIIRTFFNCTTGPLIFTQCNYSTINIQHTWAWGNHSPDQPNLSGPCLGDINTPYTYYSCTNDTDHDDLFYLFDWGDGNTSGWLGPYQSNLTINATHTWVQQGGYYVQVQAKDIFYNTSNVSQAILFKTETLPPIINSVNFTPSLGGFGGNVLINANISDSLSGNHSGIRNVTITISHPDNSTENFFMNEIDNNTFIYNFTETWLVGRYNFSILAIDNAYNENQSSEYSFNVSAQALMNISTQKNSYGSNEYINLTDPPGNPSPSLGYELLDDGTILHLWNHYDSYYFNTSNGIQLTNHKDKYWSHNVLMLGYYNNDQWHLLYRTDELTGFSHAIQTDNTTYVNITLWKDLSYAGYQFRFALRYHLGVSDNDLTIIPSIKNIGANTIPYVLGFGWEIKDIQINMTTTGDYIKVDQDTYFLNQTLDNSYTSLNDSVLYLMENVTGSQTQSLYLRWNLDLNYKLLVKSRVGQENAPVTLFVRIGMLASGQQKSTQFQWYDACQETYYFNTFDENEAWESEPELLIDETEETFTATSIDTDVELCYENTCPGDDLGTILKVELRVHGYHEGKNQGNITLRPVFKDGELDGENYTFVASDQPEWSEWFDITDDGDHGSGQWRTPWSWSEIKSLDCDVEASLGSETALFCSMVQLRVTYNTAPIVSNPIPLYGTNGITLQPLLNITVSDPDGDNMNVTWYSNSTSSLLTLNPNENGTITELERYPSSQNANYKCVDETIADDADYVKWKGTSWKKDTYHLPNHTNQSGTIHDITVYARCARVGSIQNPMTNSSAKILIRSSGNYYYGSEFKPPYSPGDPITYIDYAYTWENNPATEDAWNWTDIDNLQAGIAFIGNEGTSECTHLYVVVNYTNPSTWLQFGRNSSVGNGVYRQTYLNASVNGQWWYWKVKADDGTLSTWSSVYKFYTGYQSKIENTGETNISGYLLMQVQYYNETSENWILDIEVVNQSITQRINVSEQLGLDKFFNGEVQTNDLTYGDGTYRVYTAFRDPEGNILRTDDDIDLVSWWQFSKT